MMEWMKERDWFDLGYRQHRRDVVIQCDRLRMGDTFGKCYWNVGKRSNESQNERNDIGQRGDDWNEHWDHKMLEKDKHHRCIRIHRKSRHLPMLQTDSFSKFLKKNVTIVNVQHNLLFFIRRSLITKTHARHNENRMSTNWGFFKCVFFHLKWWRKPGHAPQGWPSVRRIVHQSYSIRSA